MTYKTYYVDGKGLGWQAAKQRGFIHRIHVDIDFYTAEQALNRSNNYSPYYVGSDARRRNENRLEFSRQFRIMLGEKNEHWRIQNFDGRDRRAYFYTADLDWMVLAKLHGFQALLDRIIKIETLNETTLTTISQHGNHS